MDKKSRVWLIVLAFLLIVVLGMCVFFKLKLDDANRRYETAANESRAAADVTGEPEATEESAVTEDAAATGGPAEAAETAATADSDITAEPEEEYSSEAVQAMTEELEASRAREAELQAEVEALQAEVDTYRGQGADAETKSGQADEASDVPETAQADDADIAAELETVQAENESLSMELDAAVAENATLSEELDAALAENEGLSSELGTVTAENELLSSELETITAENAGLDEELAAARGENAALISDLEAANITNEELRSQLEGALADNERLDGELASANARLALTEAQLQAYRGNAEYELDDVVFVAADGVSAEYSYVCSAAEGNLVVCELSVGGKTVFTSDKLAYGDSLGAFTLDTALDAGNHEALLTVETVRPDGSIASRITLPVLVIVHK